MTLADSVLWGHRLAEPLTPGTPEWFRVLSASKIAQLMNLCPPEWGDEYTLWHEMKHERHLEKTKLEMARGHEFEPMIREWFARDNPNMDVRETSTWRHNEREWQTADPDGELWLDDGTLELLEVKTASDLYQWDGVPANYWVQAQWQMATIGAARTHFAVCGPFELFDRKPKYFTVDYDMEVAATLVDRGLRHMQSLELGIEPQRVHASDKAMMATRFKQPLILDDPGFDLPDEIAEPYLRLALTELKAAEARAKDAAIALLEYMGSAKKATWRGVTVAHRIKGRNGAPPYLKAGTNATNALATNV